MVLLLGIMNSPYVAGGVENRKGVPMADLPVTYRGTVYPWHCDHMGHMNVMWYVGKFDEATWQLFALLGLSRARLSRDGTGMAGLEQHIEYKRELRAGDLVTIRSAMLEVKEKVIRFKHEMTNDETRELAASTSLLAVHFDLTARESRPLPLDVQQRANKMIVNL
jgi:acyl-CoA thioester hydrolase